MAQQRLPSPGGDWTRPRQPGPTYIAPAWHLDPQAQLDFYTGMSFFRSPWVAAPASTTARDGLGPLFNSHSCEGCHKNGGRGRSLLDDPHSLATVVRIGVLTEDGKLGPHPRYGYQLQVRATFRREGEAVLAMEEIPVEGPGAAPEDPVLRTSRLLIDPRDEEEDPGDWRVSARVAPALLGMGLLEAIAEADLLAGADPEDENRDGVSGRPHWRGEGRIPRNRPVRLESAAPDGFGADGRRFSGRHRHHQPGIPAISLHAAAGRLPGSAGRRHGG